MKKIAFLVAAVAMVTFTSCNKDKDTQEQDVAVTDVTLNKTTATLAIDDIVTLTATVLPENATNKAVTWSSSDSTVAKVANGTVTALKVGDATITATTEDGNKTAICKITVKVTKYSIGLFKTGNGIVLSDKEAAEAGDTITLTATDSTNVIFDKWVVVSGNVQLSSTSKAEVTFVMPESDVEIRAEFYDGALIGGIVWSLYNVDKSKTFVKNSSDWGLYYQFGSTVGWFTNQVEPGDILNTAGDTVWANVSTNNFQNWNVVKEDLTPCPKGWRLPHLAEFNAMMNQSTTDWAWSAEEGSIGATITDEVTGDNIFLPAAGLRGTDNGLHDQNLYGWYRLEWSRTVELSEHIKVEESGITGNNNKKRADGMSIRCVRTPVAE